MTHSDVYTKYMIEYDKAQITSSYPSQTKYEIATLLDKAYLALIAQKLTGTNTRNSIFEGDVKAIEDLRPLLTTGRFARSGNGRADNETLYTIPQDMLYYVQSEIKRHNSTSAIDNKNHIISNVRLITHQLANKFRVTNTNLPWIPEPVCYLEGDKIHVFTDSYVDGNSTFDLLVTYIKKPNKFVDDYATGNAQFELSDTMAEELINLAIIMGLETIESSRLASKIQTRPLES